MANEAGLKLFSNPYSPYGQRVAIALKEKEIPFEVIMIDFSDKPKELLEANPIHQKVPTIIHNGKPVAESLVILEYLEDAFPGQVPLMPEDALEKSKFRFWMDFISKSVTTMLSSFRAKAGSPERQAIIDESMKAFETMEEGMTSFSADGPFFTGEKFGLLDVVLGPLCNSKPVLKEFGGIVIPGPEKLPRLNKCIEAVKVHPSVSSSIASAEDTVEYLKAMYGKRAAAAAAAAAADSHQ